MEFLTTYFMPVLPVFIAFVVIWWFMTIYVLVSSIKSASRENDVEAKRAEPARTDTDALPPELRKVA